MIHSKALSQRLKSGGVLVLAGALGACASASDYPSFAIPTADNEAGRVVMRFPGVSVPEPVSAPAPSETLPTELDAYLAAISTRAKAASSAFSRNIDSARSLAVAASAGDTESDIWTNAQVRLADLTTFHSRTHIALADLDLLAAKAELSQGSPADRTAIEELRAELSRTLDGQAKALASINLKMSR